MIGQADARGTDQGGTREAINRMAMMGLTELWAVVRVDDDLACSWQRVSRITKHSESPEPVLRLKVGASWFASDTRDWPAKHYSPRDSDR